MESLPEDCFIRRVTNEEIGKVLAIRPYGAKEPGMYLEDYLPQMLYSPTVDAFAIVHDNRFIAFSFTSLTDDGKTAVSRGLRVSPDFEGRGLVRALRDHTDKSMKERKVLYKASLSDSHTDSLTKLIEKGTFRHIVNRDICHYFTNNGLLKNCVTSKCLSSKRLDVSDLQQIFSSKGICESCFKCDRVIVDWVPYRIRKSNAQLIIGSRTTVIGSSIDDPNQTLLTFSNYFNHPTGLYMHIDIYGRIGGTLDEHINSHLQNVLNYCSNNICIRLFCDEGVNWGPADTVMKKYSTEKKLIWPLKQICGEQDLHYNDK